MFSSIMKHLRVATHVGLIKTLRFWHYRRKHGIPSPDEIRYLMPIEGLSYRIREVAVLYADYGMSAAAIASKPGFGCTRERIRQMLWKIWRTQRKKRGLT